MEIYVSIDGVLRNLIQKFDYHYKDYFLNRDPEEDNIIVNEIDDNGELKEVKEISNFEYGITGATQNNNLRECYKFVSTDEYLNFKFIEYAIEIYGHAGLSYSSAISDFNRFIYENQDSNVTLIGVDEFGKAKPSTLFFLSKNGCLADTVKFIKSQDIEKYWETCDVWITDSEKIINSCPNNKKVLKFKTSYNNYFTNPLEIDKLQDINELL